MTIRDACVESSPRMFIHLSRDTFLSVDVKPNIIQGIFDMKTVKCFQRSENSETVDRRMGYLIQKPIRPDSTGNEV